MFKRLFALVCCLALAAACSSSAGTGCEDSAHEGLLCKAPGPISVGECVGGACVALPCETAEECNDREGHDACRSFECVAGTCETTPASEGFECVGPGGASGVCQAGSCL